jgi:hypothetical protein
MLKHTANIVGALAVGYIGFFFLWLLLATACVAQYDDCGYDVMTKIVRVIYPISLLK